MVEVVRLISHREQYQIFAEKCLIASGINSKYLMSEHSSVLSRISLEYSMGMLTHVNKAPVSDDRLTNAAELTISMLSDWPPVDVFYGIDVRSYTEDVLFRAISQNRFLTDSINCEEDGRLDFSSVPCSLMSERVCLAIAQSDIHEHLIINAPVSCCIYEEAVLKQCNAIASDVCEYLGYKTLYVEKEGGAYHLRGENLAFNTGCIVSAIQDGSIKNLLKSLMGVRKNMLSEYGES